MAMQGFQLDWAVQSITEINVAVFMPPPVLRAGVSTQYLQANARVPCLFQRKRFCELFVKNGSNNNNVQLFYSGQKVSASGQGGKALGPATQRSLRQNNRVNIFLRVKLLDSQTHIYTFKLSFLSLPA